MSAQERIYASEGLARLEAQLAARTGPDKTWRDYLPDKHRHAVPMDVDPTPTFREYAQRTSLPPKGVAPLTPEEIAAIDNLVRTAPPVAKVEKTAEELFPAAPPPRKKAKKETKRKAPAPAPAAPDPVSARARAALEACWDMQFGDPPSNPYRTRLTKEACAQLGMPDYHDVVSDVVDLALLRQRAKGRHYADDAALRADVRRVATNSAAYHGPDSVYTTWANDLAARYDAEYSGVGLRP